VSGSVERAVRRDLRRVDKTTRDSALAAGALELARLLDLPIDMIDGGKFAVETVDRRLAAAASATRELRAVMGELLKDVMPDTKDGIDDLRARRAARKTNTAASG
jgi:hypothetical protein